MHLLPRREVRKRYNVCDKSIQRWCQDPKLGFPPPVEINGRHYWREPELETFERSRVVAR
jgi:hypothetical protein